MARRIAASSIQWAALAERCPPAQKGNFLAFKAKSDNYLRKVLANPAEMPKIDWAFYKNNVPIPGMVDNFQKQFEALKIPYPSDTMSSQIDSLAKEIDSDIAKFKQESNARIAEYQKELAALAALLPFDQMTMEDYCDSYPDDCINSKNPKTFWPHTEDDVPPTPEELEKEKLEGDH